MYMGQDLQKDPEMDGDPRSRSPKSSITDIDQDYEETQAQSEATLQQTSIALTDTFKGSTEQRTFISIIGFINGEIRLQKTIWLIYDSNKTCWELEKLAAMSLPVGITELFDALLLAFGIEGGPFTSGCDQYKYDIPSIKQNLTANYYRLCGQIMVVS